MQKKGDSIEYYDTERRITMQNRTFTLHNGNSTVNQLSNHQISACERGTYKVKDITAAACSVYTTV